MECHRGLTSRPLTYAVAPRFAARGAGKIINISSIVAIGPEILNGVYGGSKAFVFAFSQSLEKELDDKGARDQVVLPGATATEFWDIAGPPVSNLPGSWVMTAESLVDAALLGLDRGEFVTIPSLHAGEELEAYEAVRQAALPHLSSATVAPRYAPRHARPEVPLNPARSRPSCRPQPAITVDDDEHRLSQR